MVGLYNVEIPLKQFPKKHFHSHTGEPILITPEARGMDILGERSSCNSRNERGGGYVVSLGFKLD